MNNICIFAESIQKQPSIQTCASACQTVLPSLHPAWLQPYPSILSLSCFLPIIPLPFPPTTPKNTPTPILLALSLHLQKYAFCLVRGARLAGPDLGDYLPTRLWPPPPLKVIVRSPPSPFFLNPLQNVFPALRAFFMPYQTESNPTLCSPLNPLPLSSPFPPPPPPQLPPPSNSIPLSYLLQAPRCWQVAQMTFLTCC